MPESQSKKYHYFLWMFIILAPLMVCSQNLTNNWYFGTKAGLNFATGEVTALNNSAMDTPEGCTAISDKDGQLLFYSNGATIWNNSHEIIKNGNGLAGQITNNQSTLIVPKPNSTSLFYLFSTRIDANFNGSFQPGLYYSEIEISDAYPAGKVHQKNIKLRSGSFQRIAGTYNPVDNSIRVVTFGSTSTASGAKLDTFFIYKITESGFSGATIASKQQESVGHDGALKISPNGQFIAMADYSGASIHIYNYNLDASVLSLKETVSTFVPFSAVLPYGLEFSQDSNVLYFCGEKMIFKWSLLPVSDFDKLKAVSAAGTFSFGAMQLARNGKIYVATYSDDTDIASLSVINFPEEYSGNSDFEPQKVGLDSGQSREGLPIFLASELRNRIITNSQCRNELIEFDLDTYTDVESVNWEFGNGTTSSELNPAHFYERPGLYKVKATIVIDGCEIDLFKEVEVFSVPNPRRNQILYQCVPDDSTLSVFNLNEIRDKLNLQDKESELYFYNTIIDANSDINGIQTADAYQNTSPNEELFVKIVSPQGCSNITNFFLETTSVSLNNIEILYSCESSDGVSGNNESLFDLRSKIDGLKGQFNLESSVNAQFYETYEDAQLESNRLPYDYISSSKSIWVRLENRENDCAGLDSFELKVVSPIVLDIKDRYTLCYDPVKSSIALDGGLSNQQWQWFDSNNQLLSSNRVFTVSEPGTYTVAVTKTANGITCSRVETFDVVETESSAIESVETDNGLIAIKINGTGDYQFSIDGRNFVGSGTQHTFENVRGGIYTVYAQDRDRCEQLLQTNVAIISFPKFFTPNNDGFNDRWRLYGVSREFYQSVTTKIYDRYGKTLHTMTLNDKTNGWDGYFNGQKLRSNDYWFETNLVDLEGKRYTERGHFSLKN